MSDNTPGSQGGTPYGQQNQPQYGEKAPQYGQNQPPYGQSDARSQQAASPYGQQDQSPYGQQGGNNYPGQQGGNNYPGQQGGNNYPGQQGYQGQPAENPGRTLGIVGFILAILIAPVGLIISIIAFVKSRKAKMGNGLALAGIIIGVLFTIIGVIAIVALVALGSQLAQELITACEGLPAGSPVTVQGQLTECPPQ